MNHEKRNHKQKIKSSSSKYKKKPKPKKIDIEDIIKKKVFKVGSTTEELRMQFNNFATRYINLKTSTYKSCTKNKVIKEMTDNLKIKYDKTFDINGLSVDQMKYKVRVLKQMLDRARLRRKTLYYTDK